MGWVSFGPHEVPTQYTQVEQYRDRQGLGKRRLVLQGTENPFRTARSEKWTMVMAA